MKNLTKFFLSAVFIFSLSVFIEAKEPDWLTKLRKLEVFRSTKSDVERIFSDSKITDIYNAAERERNGWSKRIEYETTDGELEVWYSTGKCWETKSTIGYDVDKDVVTELTFRPNLPFPYIDLEYDLDEFKSTSVTDVEETYIFSNVKLGVEVLIMNEKVEKVDFCVAEKHKQLECKN